MKPTPYLMLLLLSMGLCSCGLLRAPIKIAGGVAQGTARLGHAAVTKPKEAHEKRKARKEAERRDQEARDAAARGAGPTFGDGPSFGSNPTFGTEGTPLPGPMANDPTVDQAPPLPSDE
jgi:hypothetical protein